MDEYIWHPTLPHLLELPSAEFIFTTTLCGVALLHSFLAFFVYLFHKIIHYDQTAIPLDFILTSHHHHFHGHYHRYHHDCYRHYSHHYLHSHHRHHYHHHHYHRPCYHCHLYYHYHYLSLKEILYNKT